MAAPWLARPWTEISRMFLFKSAPGEFEEECGTFRCSDVAVDSRPRSSAADQALFGGEQSPRVRAASCGAIGAVCTQHALQDISTLLTALLIQCRPASCHQPCFTAFFKCCSYTWIVLEKWLLKCLLLFLGFVLSPSYVATSLSWLCQAASPHGCSRHAAHCIHTSLREERRMEDKCGSAMTSRKLKASPGNATRQPVRP